LNPYNAHIITCHGWGFNPEFWRALEYQMGNRFVFNHADRGYFGNPSKPRFPDEPQIKKVLLLHSFGLHWCDDQLFKKADHVVIMSGFMNFHPGNEDEFKRSKLTLREMQAQFVDSPDEVLKRHYINSFHPQKPQFLPPSGIQHDLLLADLGLIDRDAHVRQRIYDARSITILHGSDDLIVHKNTARDMYHDLILRSQYFEILNAGHAFPVTHADKCAEILTSLIYSKAHGKIR